VEEIHDDGRRLLVVTEDDDLIVFTLAPASGRFAEEGAGAGGARLVFE
jgi:hypothetical protein